MRNIVYDCADDDEDGVLIVPTRFVLRRTADPDLDAEDEAGAGGTTGSGTMNSGDSTTVRLSMPERETLGGDDADGSTADLTESVAGGDSSEVVLTTNSPTFALRRESAAPGLPWSRALPPRTTTVVVDRKTLLKDSVHNLARRLVANRPAHDTVQAARERILDAMDVVLHARQQALGLAGRVLRPEEVGPDTVADLAASSTNVTLRWRQVRGRTAARAANTRDPRADRGRVDSVGARACADAYPGSRLVWHGGAGDQPGHGRPDGRQDGDPAAHQRAQDGGQLSPVRPGRRGCRVGTR